jgi:hypothetical protein
MSQARIRQLADPAQPGAPEPAGRLRDLGLAWERLGQVEVGFGVAVWLRVTPSAPGLSTPGRALRIGETGQVPEIEIENRGADPVLFPAHLVLAGGWQTRAVERSVVLPAGAAARVPVKCVEAGRWAPRDEHTAGTFEVADRTGVRTRWSAARSMVDQLRFTGRFAAEQSAIWQQVDEELSRSPIASRTRSYEAYLHGVRQPFVAEVRKAGVRPPPRANAVAILPRGGGFWIEAYPTDGALAEDAEGLLADLFDPAAKGEGDASLAPELDALLEDVWTAPLRPIEPVAGTAGEAWAFEGGHGRSRDAVGAALLLDGALAHLGIGAPPRSSSASSSHDRRVGDAAQDAGARRGSGPVRTSERGPATSPESVVAADSGASERPRVDLETMRAVFGRARELMPEEPPARERVQGYRLVRVLDRNISWVDVRIGGEGYAVLGSHDRCDLALAGDNGIWLRHLAAICVRLEDDSVGLRLIDLKTDLPFFLEDETPRWSVIASGPFAMRLGRHVVCGFPIGPLVGDEPVSAPPPRVIDRRDVDPGATGVIETGGSIIPARGPSELTAFLPSAPVAQIHDLVAGPTPASTDPSASPKPIRVTLERGGMGASVELPVEALDVGVLLGRALNCFDGGLRRIFCEAISRAHVLLLRDRDGVFAYDLCSTNGTRVAGQRIRRHRMNDAGTTLELGKKVTFRWKR